MPRQQVVMVGWGMTSVIGFCWIKTMIDIVFVEGPLNCKT